MVSPEELAAVYDSLKGILQNDNVLRKKAEENFNNWLNNPQKLLLVLSKQIHGCNEDYIRRLASVLFKHFVAKRLVQESWEGFAVEVKEEIKKELLVSLTEEKNLKVARQIIQAIAELATLNFVNKDWPELHSIIMLFLSGENTYKELGFYMLEVLWGMNPESYLDKLGEVCVILEEGLKSESIGVAFSAVGALCSFVAGIDPGSTKELHKYAENVVCAVTVAANSKDESDITRVLDSVLEVADNEATYFRKVFPQLCEIMLGISTRKDYSNEKLRQIPIEILVSILEQIPGIIKKNKTLLQNICSSIFDIMISIEEEVDDSWLKPKEGYNTDEDLNPDDNVTFGMTTYDRLLEIFDDEMFPIIEKILESSLTVTDWRHIHAALMSTAQIGEYILNPDRVKNVVDIIIKHLSNPHPKVRYAALYVIGILADEMAPDFQNSYMEVLLMPLLLAVDDVVPRVQSQAFMALANFLERVPQETTLRVANLLLPKLVKAITGGISIVKENAMMCVSSVAESSKEMFLPYYPELSRFVFTCIKEIANKEYSKLRGQAIECLTIMSVAIGKNNFLPHTSSIISLLKELQDKEYPKGDQQRLYILGAWQRIVLCLGKDMAPFLPDIMPRIMAIGGSVQTEPKENLSSVINSINDEKSSLCEVTTDDIEEKEIFIQMIAVFAVQLEETYAPYVQETARIVVSIMRFQVNSELKKSSVKVLPSLLRCLKNDKEKFIDVGKAFINEIMSTLEKEIKTEIKSEDVISLKIIIDQMDTFMQLQEVEALIGKIFIYNKESNERRELILTTKNELFDDEDSIEDNTEECENQYEENAEAEEAYQKHLTYLLGSIVNTHKDACLNFVPEIINEIIRPNVKGNSNQQKNGLFAADDLVDFLTYEQLGNDNWKFLAETIASYVSSDNPTLRQAACYGMGCLAKNGQMAFKQIAVNCLNLLSTSIGIKKRGKDDVLWGGARDSTVCAVGRILQYQGAVIPFQEVWGRWLQYLPLTEDEDEAKEIHGFVVDCIMNKPEMAVGAQGENLKDLIRILVKIYSTTLITEQTKGKIATVIKQLGAHPQVAPMLNGIYNEVLTVEEKKKLEEIVASTTK